MRLQAAVRMHIVRSLYLRQQQAAVLLQSAFRRVKLRTRFLQVGNESMHNARKLKTRKQGTVSPHVTAAFIPLFALVAPLMS